MGAYLPSDVGGKGLAAVGKVTGTPDVQNRRRKADRQLVLLAQSALSLLPLIQFLLETAERLPDVSDRTQLADGVCGAAVF